MQREPDRRRQTPLIVLVGGEDKVANRAAELVRAGIPVLLTPDTSIGLESILPEDAHGPSSPGHVMVLAGDLVIDLTSHEATCDGTLLDLTERELQLLGMLAKDVGRACSTNELYAGAWDRGPSNAEAVRCAIRRLRRKLSAAGASITIEAVRGVGFRARLRDP